VDATTFASTPTDAGSFTTPYGAIGKVAGTAVGGDAGTVISYAGQGAAIGSVVPGVGTAIGAAIGAGVGLLSSMFGGGGTYLSNSGYGWIGQVSDKGFTPEKSTAYTMLSDGTANNWAPGANASWHDVFDPLNKAFAQYFPALGSQDITIQARSGTTSTGLTNAIGSQLAAIFSKPQAASTIMGDTTTSNLSAPTVATTTMPAGTPGVLSLGMSGTSGSTVAPAPAAAAPIVAGVPNWLMIGAAVYLGVHIWGKK